MSPLMTSLDLFSGVGGITHALSGIAKPIAYCEIDKGCQQILQKLMKKGMIPKANIQDDVKNLRAKTLGVKSVDMIIGGWPCQDLSMMGKRKGLKGERSGLIYEIFRLTDELSPGLLFLENVPAVLNSDFDIIITEFVVKRGYELRWVVLPASALGAHHVRKRWFGLFIKPSFMKKVHGQLSWLSTAGYQPFFNNKPKEPSRMVLPKSSTERSESQTRAQILGNSVVPDAVRSAFLILASGFMCTSNDGCVNFKTLLTKPQKIKLSQIPDNLGDPPKKPSPTSWGFVKAGTKMLISVKQPRMPTPNLKLVIDPKSFKKKGYVSNPANTTDIYTKRVVIKSWSTPRHTSGSCIILTHRSIRDLPTQVRFEVNTPNQLRSGIIAPNFLEWLMGYPKDWTKY
jgi:site-specific DNA-cytosine methylase